ncbi:MAG: signal peptidase I [Dehalococcoidales bacterium]|nr:signal peptidase I [Dehalococcoidales bacterium]
MNCVSKDDPMSIPDVDKQATLHSGFDVVTREILARGSRVRFLAHGNSMAPFIRNGDIIVVEPARADELHIGDIVFFRRYGGRHVVHRLVARYENSDSLVLTTRGDNLGYCDAPVLPEQVLGRVIRIESKDRELRISGTSGRMLNRLLLFAYSNAEFTRSLLRRGLTKLWWFVGGEKSKG